MILQALKEYYDRKAVDPEGGLAPEGFEPKAIPFVLVLDVDGRLVQLADRREGEGKKRVAKSVLVPQGVKKTSGLAANLLWDTAEYVLGIDTKGKPRRVIEQHAAFRERLRVVFSDTPEDAGVHAVLRFLEHHCAETMKTLAVHPVWPEILETNPVLTFRLKDDTELVCQRPAVIAALTARHGNDSDGRCLVSGEADSIERLHAPIKGVWGAHAPVGKRAAFAYTTALNHLLAKGSRQRIQVGDASTVFWAEKSSGAAFESAFLDFLNPPHDDPDASARSVASLYRSVRDGKPFTADDGQCFYVLGLAPNAARIAVRFWHVAAITELSMVFRRYFDEVEIARPSFDSGTPLTIFRLLTATALLGKAENIPPNLGGDVMRAILSGGRYPETLLQGALRRIRAEHVVTWPRAALLKAYLIRNLNDKEMTVSLNEGKTDSGYRLGRLFAALERVQERAQGNLNASIRERYYGAFSATPVMVLPLLMKLKNHHLAKLPNRGEAVNLEKLFASIIAGIDTVPARLTLAEQAQLAVGYYHQRQAFFSKPDSETPDQPAE
jgi:CRISPR-associated protein Csd1